jgi:hypothetical protein
VSSRFALFPLLPALGALTLAGCANINPYRPPPASPHADARVSVQNSHWQDLTVYLEREGGRMRLGVVPGNSSRTLSIPDPFVTPNSLLRLVAVSSGRETHGISEYFELGPGSRASWSVGITGLATPVTLVPPET